MSSIFRTKDYLADCFAFLDIINNSGISGLGSYIYLTEYWQEINKSILYFYNNQEEFASYLTSIESVFQEAPDSLSFYREITNENIQVHPVDEEAGEKVYEYFKDCSIENIIHSPVTIYQTIRESNNNDLNRILFAFYLDVISSVDTTQQIKESLNIDNKTFTKEGSKSISRNFHANEKSWSVLPEFVFKTIKLTELNLKITKYNYTIDLDKLDILIQDNLNIIKWHIKNEINNIYNNDLYEDIYAIYYPGDIVKSLIRSNQLLKMSYLSSDNRFLYLNEIYDLLVEYCTDLSISFSPVNLNNFQCILFDRAKNAYKYGLISKNKFARYEKKLKGIEKKQLIKARERLENINYVNSPESYPAIRTTDWSQENISFYENEIKPNVKVEKLIEINFNSALYFDYIKKYFKETAFSAYKSCNRKVLLDRGLHLSRIYKMYESEFTSINMVKGMLLDAHAYKEYEKLMKWSSRQDINSTPSLDEIISVQHKFDNILKFSGELFLSQVNQERQKKIIKLFKDEIVTHLNNYIDKHNLQYLPLELFNVYTDKKYIDSNFQNLKNQWLEENFYINENYPYKKEEVINALNSFKIANEAYNPFNDIYRERHDIITEQGEEFDFDFVEVPKVKIPHPVTEFIELALIFKFRNIIDDFIEVNDLKIGDDRWISEKYLYYKVRELFPELPVVRHASPKWLGRQHFDIYLPTKNIAIEYNGKQHYEIIDYFGGVEGFEERKKLDQQKLQKAKNNNTVVIIHKYDDDFNNTIEHLKEQFNLYS